MDPIASYITRGVPRPSLGTFTCAHPRPLTHSGETMRNIRHSKVAQHLSGRERYIDGSGKHDYWPSSCVKASWKVIMNDLRRNSLFNSTTPSPIHTYVKDCVIV